jgi:hypothetical protein
MTELKRLKMKKTIFAVKQETRWGDFLNENDVCKVFTERQEAINYLNDMQEVCEQSFDWGRNEKKYDVYRVDACELRTSEGGLHINYLIVETFIVI